MIELKKAQNSSYLYPNFNWLSSYSTSHALGTLNHVEYWRLIAERVWLAGVQAMWLSHGAVAEAGQANNDLYHV